ncbi:ATP-dependent DNA ligase [Candidatus Bathyarchaeota archaeon]|nr:ATP-dependent DNA ligase [Candidatus Bathyarchaeota archaeon]
MKFSRLVEAFEKLEKTSSRNAMIKVLAKLFQESTVGNIDKICYFTLGRICAGYEDINIGLGNKMVQDAISVATDVKVEEIEKRMKEIGDLGEVVKKLEIKEKSMKGELSVEDVYESFLKIAKATSSGSVEIKKKNLAALLVNSEKKERKYIVRLATGEMRLGVAEMTLLDALAVAFLGSKEDRPVLEHAYNICSDIGYVAKTLVKSGLKGVKRIRIALNRPIRPMLAQRVSKMSEIREKIESKEIAAEEKYDGERLQAHKNGDEVKLFSRRLTDITDQFPDVVENVRKNVEAEKAILDGEVVAYDFNNRVYYPFQKLMHRRRKYEVEKYADKIPVKYMLFDLLYLNRRSYMRKSYPERREGLEKIVKNLKYIAITDRIKSSNLDDIDDFFQDCIKRGLEGIVCKSCGKNSYYRAGAREWIWIKWKKSYASELSDTLDLVVVGAYAGRGKRGGTYGSMLCAAYNHEEDMFQTVCKLGTGLSDKELKNLPDKLVDVSMDEKPARVFVAEETEPDYWFSPKYVLEVRGSEITESPVHTCNWNKERRRGLALRFPRFERWRPEKAPEQATTVQEIADIFLTQKREK